MFYSKILIFILYFSFALYCKEKEIQSQSLSKVSQNDLKQQVIKYLEQGAIVIDVRTEEEYKNGHFKDAIFIPYHQIEKRIKELEIYKDTPILLYCRSGRRANIAKQVLEQYGFKNVINVINLDSFPTDRIVY